MNMASICRSARLDRTTAEYWTTDLDVNVRGAFMCARAAFAHMRGHGGGRVVNFADWLPRSGRPQYKDFTSHYVAKAGVVALTEALALEGARDNILVNADRSCLHPTCPRRKLDEVAETTSLGRWA